MGVLSDLEPKEVFRYFEEICRIPHGSGHTRQISDYLVRFAGEHALRCRQDEKGNVIIWKDGTDGNTDAPAVMLQGHMDMVCEKDPGSGIDFMRDGITPVLEGGVVTADGTTLGADDGIGVAFMLAILASDTIPHPPLEAVFTVDEEIGMLGAAALDTSDLKAKYMINLDAEVEECLQTGCAGGALSTCRIPVSLDVFAGEETSIRVDGGIGGHSGLEIDRGRANAIQLLGRVLKRFGQTYDFRLMRIDGGGRDNVIPSQASAVLVTQAGAPVRDMIALVRQINEEIAAEYKETDPGVKVSIAIDQDIRVERGIEAFDLETTGRIVSALTQLPGGVQKMSEDVPGLVQTSLNLGTIETKLQSGNGKNAGEVRLMFCVRSSVESEKRALLDQIRKFTEALGGKVRVQGDFSAWEYRKDSALRELMTDVFKEQYGHNPEIQIIHAGVECGLFTGKMPDLDCVSIGPHLRDIHTPRENMEVASVQRTWQFLREVLRRLQGNTEEKTAKDETVQDDSRNGGSEMSKALVAYFSAGGVTERLAKDLADGAGADVFAIEPEVPYTKADLTYVNPVARCNREKIGKKDVPYVGKVEDMAQYDTVYIGFPIWYSGAPNVVKTFIKDYDFSGKKVAIFVTSGGTGIGKIAEKLQPLFGDGADIVAAERFNANAGAELMKAWAKRAL